MPSGPSGRRSAQREALASFADALRREVHHLPQADLGAHAEILWQQMHNRLQWEPPDKSPSLTAELLARERERRTASGSAWLRSITRLRESSSMTRTLAAHSGETSCCAYAGDTGLLV